MNGRAWICALFVTTLVAGCSGESDPNGTAPTSTADDVALAATLTQSRVNEGTRIINAELTNTSDAPVVVDTVKLDSSQFATLAPADKGSTFAPGQTIDLAIEYGDPICDGELKQTSFTVGLDDGSTVELSIDAAGMQWLNRLYTKECALESVSDIATIEYGPTFTRATVDGELVLTGELVLKRPSGSDTSTVLTVRSLAGSVLVRFDPNPASALPAQLTPGLEELRIPIEFGAFRCDQHARGQSSQTFLLSVFVKPPDLPQQRVILAPDEQLQGEILDLIDDVCGDAIF